MLCIWFWVLRLAWLLRVLNSVNILPSLLIFTFSSYDIYGLLDFNSSLLSIRVNSIGGSGVEEDNDLEDDDETPRASIQATQIKDKTSYILNGNNHTDDSHNIFPIRKPPLPSQTTTNESADFYSTVELMRSKWFHHHSIKRARL